MLKWPIACLCISNFLCAQFFSGGNRPAMVSARQDVLQIQRDGAVYEIPRGGRAQRVSCPALQGVSSGPDKLVVFQGGKAWLSDGRRVMVRSCASGPASVCKLPEKLERFDAFAVTEDERLVLWGASFTGQKQQDEIPLGLLVDPENGRILNTFYTVKASEIRDFYDAIDQCAATITKVEDYVVIGGLYSGRLTFFNPRSGKVRDVQVIDEANLPPRGEARVNNGEALTQLVSMPGNELLVGVRYWAPPREGQPGSWVDLFRILNLSDFSLLPPMPSYRGVDAAAGALWVDWDQRPHLLKTLESDLQLPAPQAESATQKRK